MAPEDNLAAEIQALRGQLTEARATIQALTNGRIDGGQKVAPLLGSVAPDEVPGRAQVLRAIFDGVNDGILLLDSSGVFIDANSAACTLFGVAKPQLIGRRTEDFAAPGFDATAQRKRIAAASGLRGVLPILWPDGTLRELEYHAARDILPGLHLSVVRDVTEQKRAATALAASEMKYRQIVDTAREGIWLLDDQGRTTFVNRALEVMLGREPGEMMGRSVYDFTDDEGRALAEGSLARRRLGVAERKHQKYLHRDGTAVWVLMEASPFFDQAGNYAGALAMVTDVTDARRIEEALRFSEERYRLLFESSPLPIWLTDVETLRLLAANQAVLRLFGYTHDEFLSLSVGDVLLPDELAKAQQTIREESVQRTSYGVRRATRKDGAVIQVEISSQTFVLGGRRVRLVIGQDLTERNKLESQLAQSRKMEAVGMLAGGVAHDFNNLLSIIVTYATFALDQLESTDPVRADVEHVASASARAVTLVRQLLAFSRQQLLEPKVIDLNATIFGIESMLRRLLGESIDVALLVEPALGRINADPGQVEQVIINLVVNARDAMPDGGQLTIDTANVTIESAGSNTPAGLKAGQYVRLRVTDTGAGIDAATRERIFEPFFTTKEVGKGAGLGLPTVLGIVQQSGGHVDVHSEVGRGTAIDVFLPCVDTPLAPNDPAPPRAAPRGGSETLLVVEDDEQVRSLTRSILKRNGYDVLSAANGAEAIRISEQHPSPIHLLVTDLIMPRMTGHQLAEHLSALRPDMKVLFMTGYTDDAVVRQGVLDADIHLLQKPVTPEALARTVRAVLDLPSNARAR